MTVSGIFVSPVRIYVGPSEQPAAASPIVSVERAELVAGRGIRGDRYFGYRENYKGQVSFFSEEVWRRLCEETGTNHGPGVFRRNLLVRGIDLLSLVGCEFELQGIRFQGTEHCAPCRWMDQAFGPGTLRTLAEWKAGGLRARVLSGGWLAREAAFATSEIAGSR